MKRWNAVLMAGFVFATLSFGSDSRAEAPVFQPRYEGGNLPLKQNHAVNVTVAGNEMVLVQHGKRFALPLETLNRISCSSQVQRRFGSAVLGLVPVLRLGNSEEHFVGVSWASGTQAGNARTVEVVFRLSAADYRAFVAALEQQTGKRAVDTRKTPTAVHYDL